MSLSPATRQALEQQLGALTEKLDTEQLLWASGYMAGLAAAGGTVAVAPESAPRAAASESLTIWYGSETGNGRGVATRLSETARTRGYAVDLASVADVQPRRIGKLGLLILVMSTHGEGDPPEDAEALHQLVTSERAPRLDNLRYAVFALGDSSYPDFCQTGRDFDEALEALGAKRVLDRVDCDVDFEADEDSWRERILDTVKPLLETAGSTQPRLQVVRQRAGEAAPPPAHDRRNPYAAEVLEVSPLTVAPSRKQVGHLALSLEDSGLSWQPGDSVGLWPRNDARLVAEVLELTGGDGSQVVERGGQRLPLETWLREHLELTQVVRPFLERYAELASAERLRALVDDRDALVEYSRSRQVPDVLREYPRALDANQLVETLRGIAPRLYSIASSPLVADDEIHLTVKLEGGERGGLLRAGVASWQMLDTSRPGDRLRIYVEANPRFRLPEDGDRPVIMIGPGTGVAPFRAFVEHRQARGDGGKTWLFFGEQHRRTDFLYQLEWQRHLRQGSLHRLSVAFSRDQPEKLYVQHRLLEQGAEVYAWLEAGAHVYVCGSGQAMAGEVHRALAEVVAVHGGHSAERAEAYLAELKAANRYQKDVY